MKKKEILNNKEIGANIKKYRKEKGLTQDQLAKKIHKSKSVLQKYENGVTAPSLEIISDIAKELGIFPHFLIGVDAWAEHDPNTKQLLSESNATEGIEDIIAYIYGEIELKTYIDQFGEDTPYYVVGSGEDSFALKFEMPEILLNAIKDIIKLVIDSNKLSESEYTNLLEKEHEERNKRLDKYLNTYIKKQSD